jgi:bacterioferritin (cytochrome b1)
MTHTTSALLRELNTLLRLTNTETMIAQTRQSQARDAATKRELAGNAKDALQRAQQIRTAIRNLGGAPDVLGIALGRVGVLAKTQFEQGQVLTDALLGDLQLEHQLRDRAAFVRMVAETAGNRDIARLGERLEKSHTETIDWIRTRLAEVAVGSDVAIQPTPVQATVGAVRRFAAFPVRQAALGVNRSVQLAGRWSNRAEESFESSVDRAQQRIGTNIDKGKQLAEAASEILGAGRDAALERTEDVARDEGAPRTAKAARTTRRNIGALNADELPIRGYDELSAEQAKDRIERLDDATDVRAILAYEEANKGRKTVIKAANEQFTAIADVAKNGGSIRANRREEIIDLTVDELRDRAAKIDVEGRSSMSKDELVAALTR